MLFDNSIDFAPEIWYTYSNQEISHRRECDIMALTKEDLSAISNLLQPLNDKVQDLSDKVQSLDDKVQGLDDKVQGLDDKVQSLDDKVQEINLRTTNIELTLENETNRNIQLLAENHINLIDKLNQSIKVADKTLMYEVQMTSLKSRVEHLEKEVAEIKGNIA